MDRLTKRSDYNCACWNGNQDYVIRKRYLVMLDALAAYEDTGLTPDEIAAMRAENDMLKDTMIRACVWLDVHGRPGIPDVTRTLSEAVASTVKQGGPQ
jgi:hypothetical protein